MPFPTAKQAMIFGNVNANCSKNPSSDAYIVSRPSQADVGLYRIDFTEPFTEMPTAVVTQNTPAWDGTPAQAINSLPNCVVVSLSKAGMLVLTGDEAGTPTDRNFSFLVIGLR